MLVSFREGKFHAPPQQALSFLFHSRGIEGVWCRCQIPIVDSNLHHASHEKKSSHFPLNPGYLIGILLIVYYNPHITGVGFHPQHNPLNNKTGAPRVFSGRLTLVFSTPPVGLWYMWSINIEPLATSTLFTIFARLAGSVVMEKKQRPLKENTVIID